uniref:Uncharacterized protein n=1 Tax=Anguilla anguilla TaxID=7936 RepID=A0A0E9TXB0_ANGAN
MCFLERLREMERERGRVRERLESSGWIYLRVATGNRLFKMI